MPIVNFGSQNFSQGWVTSVPAHLLEDGATPNTTNVDFSESLGRLTKRKGHSLLVSANVGSIKTTGLYEFIKADGTTKLLASSNDDVYEVANPSTWTSRHNNASLNGADVNFATFDDLCIFVSENLTTQKWTGTGASSNLLGTPPSNGKFIVVHKNRVWIANHGGGKSRVSHSARDNAEDWTTANDAGFVDIEGDDGDIITGMVSLGNVLLVFKNKSTYVIKGYLPSNFSVSKISPSVGCIGSRTIVACDKFAMFLSSDGVYAANSDGVVNMSANIKPSIDTLSDATRRIAAAGKLRTQYWLAIDTDADSKNDEVYYLDFLYGVWGRYTNKKESVFYTRRDGTLISGGFDTDVVRLHDDTNNDNGSAISWLWDTKDFDFNDWTKRKIVHDIILSAAPISGKTITIAHLLDGVVQGTTMSFSLTASGSQDKVYFRKRHLPATANAPYVRFRFTNAETDARIQLFGYSIAASVEERSNG